MQETKKNIKNHKAMNRVKYITITFALFVQLFFTSCDNRKDYFIEINKLLPFHLLRMAWSLQVILLMILLKWGTLLFLLFH